MKPAKQAALFAVVALTALAAGYCTAVDWALFPPPASNTKAAPSDFTLPDLNGRKRSLKDWRGQVVLLNFWATWCAPCREEIPLFQDAQRRFGEQGLQVVGIAIDDAKPVTDFHRRYQLAYPVLLAKDQGFDLMASYGNSHGGLPFSVLIGPDGKIISRKLGAYDREELESVVIKALKIYKNQLKFRN